MNFVNPTMGKLTKVTRADFKVLSFIFQHSQRQCEVIACEVLRVFLICSLKIKSHFCG